MKHVDEFYQNYFHLHPNSSMKTSPVVYLTSENPAVLSERKKFANT